MPKNNEAPKKPISATKMLRAGVRYGHEKLIENSHKDNLLGRGFDNLEERLAEEYAEFQKALTIYRGNRTERNAEEVRREGGDCINFLSAIMAKTEGFDFLERK